MPSTLVELTAEIVSSHASTVELTSDELLVEIQKVHAMLQALDNDGTVAMEQSTEAEEPAKPALNPKKSIQKNQVVCLLCGKDGFKTLTRHLSLVHNMKPVAYRKQFGLPAGTPLAAKAYSEARRAAALKNNLGEKLAKGRVAYQAEQKKLKAASKAKPASKKPAPVKKTPVKKETAK